MPVRIGSRLRAAFASGDFESLRALYAPEALLDWTLPGERLQARGPDEIVCALASRWRGGELLRWDESRFTSGVTVEFEGRMGGRLARQRQFVQVRGGRVVRHQAYCARPHGAEPDELPDDGALAAARRLGTIARREPLTHAGQSGNSLERIVLADGRNLVAKRLSPDDWIARNTHDEGREVELWEQGVLARMPAVVDHAVLDAGRDRDAGWLLMRDVSRELLPPDRRLTRAESRRLLAAAAALHRVFAGERIVGLCTLADRISLTAPRLLAREGDAPDYLPKILVVGWEVFFDTVPADVGDAVADMLDDPEPAAAALARFARTLVHGDLRGANVGLARERIVALDWGLASEAPPELDFAWYLFVNGWRIDATRENLIEDFCELEGDLHDRRALAASWIAQLCWHGGLLAHELVESSDEKRERARAELDWWVQRARESLEVL